MTAVRCEVSEVRQLLESISSARTNSAGRITLDELLMGASTYKLIGRAGETVGAYVLAERGPLVWIMAAVGRAQFDLCELIDALMVEQGGRFEEAGFRTERRGLVRKAQRLGWELKRRDGPAYYLRKNLRP